MVDRNPRQYLGVKAQRPPTVIRATRAPTTADIAYDFNTIWVYTTTNDVYMFTNSASGSGTWTVLGTSSSTTVPVSSGGTGRTTLTAHGVLLGEGTSAINQSTAGTAGMVFTSGGASADGAYVAFTSPNGTIAITSNASTQGFDVINGGTKVNIASTGGTLAVNNAYTVTQSSQTSFALPATAAVGSIVEIDSATGNTSGWIITQATGQIIYANTNHTTSGATGTLAGAIHCSVRLRCVVANNEWIVIGGSGLTGYTFT